MGHTASLHMDRKKSLRKEGTEGLNETFMRSNRRRRTLPTRTCRSFRTGGIGGPMDEVRTTRTNKSGTPVCPLLRNRYSMDLIHQERLAHRDPEGGNSTSLLAMGWGQQSAVPNMRTR